MKKRKVAEKKAASFGKALAIGLCVGLCVWAVLLLGASGIIAGLDEPENFILPAVFVLAAAAAASAGATSARLVGSGILLPGAVTGGILLGAVWALSLAFAGAGENVVSLPLRALLCVEFPLFSLIGAKLVSPSRKPKRHAHR